MSSGVCSALFDYSGEWKGDGQFGWLGERIRGGVENSHQLVMKWVPPCADHNIGWRDRFHGYRRVSGPLLWSGFSLLMSIATSCDHSVVVYMTMAKSSWFEDVSIGI